ncbi:hypothetical protein ABH922_002721 [Rhodococcus sp. 27YEA15]
MTGSVGGVRPRSDVLLSRTAAVLAVVSAAAHLLTFPRHTAHSSLAAVVVGVMAIGCLGCARHLWRGAGVQMWGAAAIMTTLMIGTHLSMSGGGGSSQHVHGAPVLAPASATSGSWIDTAIVIVAAIEVVLTTTVVFARTRSVPTELDWAQRPASRRPAAPAVMVSAKVPMALPSASR